MNDLANQFLKMIAGGLEKKRQESDDDLAAFILTWPDLSDDEKRRCLGIVTTDLLLQAAIDKGSRRVRVRRWLAFWWYQLPIFTARR